MKIWVALVRWLGELKMGPVFGTIWIPDGRVYNCVFCGNWLGNDAPTWRHFACSLKNDAGYRRRLSGWGECFVCWKRGGTKETVSLCITRSTPIFTYLVQDRYFFFPPSLSANKALPLTPETSCIPLQSCSCLVIHEYREMVDQQVAPPTYSLIGANINTLLSLSPFSLCSFWHHNCILDIYNNILNEK